MAAEHAQGRPDCCVIAPAKHTWRLAERKKGCASIGMAARQNVGGKSMARVCFVAPLQSPAVVSSTKMAMASGGHRGMQAGGWPPLPLVAVTCGLLLGVRPRLALSPPGRLCVAPRPAGQGAASPARFLLSVPHRSTHPPASCMCLEAAVAPLAQWLERWSYEP